MLTLIVSVEVLTMVVILHSLLMFVLGSLIVRGISYYAYDRSSIFFVAGKEKRLPAKFENNLLQLIHVY